MSDVYYDPQKFGLEIILSLDRPDMSYEFDMFVVWFRREDGAVFYATDSGCSCPSPFENVQSVKELFELKDMKAFESELKSWGDSFMDAQAIQSVIDKVHVVKVYKSTILTD